MFLIQVPEENIREWKTTLQEKKEAKDFYDALYRGEYDIYYSFDVSKQRILYEALPNTPIGQYHSLYVGIDRTLSSIRQDTEDPYSEALALYIHEREITKSESELMEIYTSDYQTISSLSSLSAEDARERKDMLPLFSQLSKEIFNQAFRESTQSSKKLLIAYVIETEDEEAKTFLVRVKAGEDRLRFLKDSMEFALHSRSGGMVQLHNSYQSITPEQIPQEDQAPLSILANEGRQSLGNYGFYSGNRIRLTREGLSDFLFSLTGREVRLDDETYKVDTMVTTPGIMILDNGSIHLTPEVKGTVYTHGKEAVMIDREDKLISLLNFNNIREATLYQFVSNHPTFRFDLFSNEVASDILPVMEDNISISERFKETHPIRKEEIRYYVTYTDKDTLSFRTEYLNGFAPVSKSVFVSHPLGENKYKKFMEALDYLDLPEEGELTSQDQIMSFLRADLLPIRQYASVLLSENLVGKKIAGIGKVNVRVHSGIDWLNMEVGSDLYTDQELATILSAYKKKKKYVYLRNSFIAFDEKESSSFKELVDDFDLDSLTSEQLPIYDALKLSSYQDEDVSVLYNKEIKDLFDDIKNFKEEKVDLEPGILSQLRPYQLDGVKWLHVLVRHHLSGILADDMGLGKTLEMISLLSLSKVNKPILIVSPKSLIYNWENEFHKWNPCQRVYVLDGDKTSRSVLLSQIDEQKKDVYITSYDSLRNDLDQVEKYSFSYLILDEGQNIANVYAKKTKAVKEIACDHKFVLTGTPIQNSLMDLWSIFDFLMPGYLPGYKNFLSTYGSKLVLDDPEQKDILMKKVTPFVLKRTKKEVLNDLPPKEEQVLMVGMSEKQRALYDAYIQNARKALENPSDRIAILAEITRLREICVDPDMFIENYDDVSEKLLTAVTTIRSAIENGHKVLVFSTFAKTLLHLVNLLKDANIDSYLIMGNTKAKDRITLADDFNTKDDVKVMLVSLKAGGTGLNLVGADIVIHLDPWWNLAAENQASDRAHRIGQKRSVTVLKMVCKDSIEEKVIQLQEKKKELSTVINEGEEAIMKIDTEDLRFLLE